MPAPALDRRPPRRPRRADAEGEVAAQEVPVVLAQVLNEHLAGFSKTEWSQLKDMLRRMVANGEAAGTRTAE